jgi:hypothetical protein
MGLTKCCCCVDLLKGVKILGIVLTIGACIGIIATIVSSIQGEPDSLYELIVLIPGSFRGQFHQHFMCAFFVQKQIQQLSLVRFQLCNFWCQNFVQKTRIHNIDEIDPLSKTA